MAEIERNLISMRTREALALRRAEEWFWGRRHSSYTKMNVLIKNRQVVITMLNKGKSISDIANISIFRAIRFAKFRMKYPSVQRRWTKRTTRISRFKTNKSSSLEMTEIRVSPPLDSRSTESRHNYPPFMCFIR